MVADGAASALLSQSFTIKSPKTGGEREVVTSSANLLALARTHQQGEGEADDVAEVPSEQDIESGGATSSSSEGSDGRRLL